MVLPDTRAVSLKGVGNRTINGRTKTGPASVGSVIEDTMQGHYHEFARTADGNFSPWLEYQDERYSTINAGVGGTIVPGGIKAPRTDGTNGTPRTGKQTQDCTIGTNFGITY